MLQTGVTEWSGVAGRRVPPVAAVDQGARHLLRDSWPHIRRHRRGVRTSRRERVETWRQEHSRHREEQEGKDFNLTFLNEKSIIKYTFLQFRLEYPSNPVYLR